MAILNVDQSGLLEEILGCVLGDDPLFEGIISLVRLDHLDDLGHTDSAFFLQRCYYFLCHGLLDLFVKGHTLEDGIVLLEFHPVRAVLLVLGGDVPRCSRHAGILVLCALQDDLYPISFLGHLLVLLLLAS